MNKLDNLANTRLMYKTIKWLPCFMFDDVIFIKANEIVAIHSARPSESPARTVIYVTHHAFETEETIPQVLERLGLTHLLTERKRK